MRSRTTKNPLWIILFTVFIDVIGFGILIPIIPLLVASPDSSFYLLPKGFSLGQGYILLGFLTAIYPLMQFFSTPILGQLSDKMGRKKLLAFSIFGNAVAYSLFAFGISTANLSLLFISRAIAGLTGGNISIAQAAIADITTPRDRVKNFGLMGAAFGLGFIVGPFFGGKFADPTVVGWFNATTPFWFAGLLSLFNGLSVTFFLPETLKVKRVVKKVHFAQSIKNIIRAYEEKHLRALFLTSFIMWSGLTFFFTFLSVFLINKFNFNQSNIGDFFAYIGLWVIITQGFLVRQVSRFLREAQVLRFSIFLMGIGVLAYFFPHNWIQLLFVTPVFAIANGLTQANFPGLISRSVDSSIQGEILGINASLQALAQAVFPLVSGVVAARLSPEDTLVISAIVIVTSGIYFIFFYKPHLVHKDEIEK